MTISRELFPSILAMDSYNRGYDEGIADLGGIGSQIGSATIDRQSEVLAGSDQVQDGFYALTYAVDGSQIDDWGSQTEVLSFRGTDSPIDYLTGWFIGAGDIYLGA